MLALEQWAEGRFKPMAMLTQVVALAESKSGVTGP